jgi:hypothetical protein
MGVKIIAIGSDAHKVHHLGEGIEEAYLLVQGLRKRTSIKGKAVSK